MGRWMQVLSKPPEPMDWSRVDSGTVVAENDPHTILSVRRVLPKLACQDFVVLCRIADFEAYEDENLFLDPKAVKALAQEFERFLRIREHGEFSPHLTATHIQEHWTATSTDIDRITDVLARASSHRHWLRMML